MLSWKRFVSLIRIPYMKTYQRGCVQPIRTSGVAGTQLCRAISPDLRSFRISRSYHRKENKILKKIGWFWGDLLLNRCLADARHRSETFDFFFQKEESSGTERVKTLKVTISEWSLRILQSTIYKKIIKKKILPKRRIEIQFQTKARENSLDAS